MRLENFNLISLKEIFKNLKDLGYFDGIMVHQTNKHDVVVLLRNTGLIDEEPLNHISYFDSREAVWFKVFPSGKRYNRGELVRNIKKIYKNVVLDFN